MGKLTEELGDSAFWVSTDADGRVTVSLKGSHVVMFTEGKAGLVLTKEEAKTLFCSLRGLIFSDDV